MPILNLSVNAVGTLGMDFVIGNSKLLRIVLRVEPRFILLTSLHESESVGHIQARKDMLVAV